MRKRVRSRVKPLAWAGLLALAFTTAGCRRAVKPEVGGDRTVEAGVPAAFGAKAEGAPVVQWEFGDGQQAMGASASHAYWREGTYTVRALHEGQEVGRAVVTVVPRPLLRAIPEDAQLALYVPRLRGNVEPLVTFYSQLVGPENARLSLERAPLVPLVLRSLSEGAGPGVVDPEEGLGFFALPAFDGVVGLLGVTEPEAALDAAVHEFESAGHEVTREADGQARIVTPEGSTVYLFSDRGYLYLAMPEEAPPESRVEETLAEERPEPSAGSRDVAVLRRAVEGYQGEGLRGVPLLESLRGKVAEGNVYFYSRPSGPDAPQGVRGVLASLRAQGARADLDGFLAMEQALFGGKRGPDSALLDRAPLGPVAAALFSVPPEELAKLVFGAPGSEQRARAVERMRGRGLDAEALLGALRGDVVALAYFDAPAFYRNFLINKRPDMRGTLLVNAGLTRAEPVVAALSEWLRNFSGAEVERRDEGGVTRFRSTFMEQPAVLTVAPNQATLQLGEPLGSRPMGDVGAALRQRLGAGAFDEGHMSAMLDVGRLRSELEAPREVPGVPQAQLNAARAFGGAFLDQLTPLDHLAVDFTPEEGGGRLTGRAVLRPR
ncbi:PKD domain-containing protein [Myxococcaceae bacterium GXIMD 01537]